MLKQATRLTLIALLLGGFLAACGDDNKSDNASSSTTTEAAAKAPELAVSAKEYAFTTATSVQAGYVKISLSNEGKEGHQSLVARINDGVTPQQLQEAQAKGPDAALGLVTLKGGVNAIAPGTKQSVTSKLDPGSYLMICFLPTTDGSTHAQKGMVSPFTVTAPASSAEEPAYKAEIEAKDFTFDIPTLKAGEQTIEFKNAGPSPHEGTLYKLADGKTAADAQTFLGAIGAGQPPSGPPPFTEAGGGPAIAPGSSAWPTLNLEPGTYVLTCFVPDQKTGKPHIALGMFKSFEVK